ncbi:hypothetical protein DOTSEDRAFT_75929 [Dothistroma septosporum NZE10]|uniref:C2H2-type domain-containing protein n=1 Tax=Dothistroma septosporum (strain NZE10 / CBS 128990) TaxID=675120 RepID=N1PDR2_DOTSN|nr:hypothetical protein DOTSEDRAFT_75929 [Dothistroma septosporum NZE10]
MSGTPSIMVSQHQRVASPPRYTSCPIQSLGPMAIPRAQEAVPPPLPPPNYLPEIAAGHDPGWQWGNDPNGSDFGRTASVRPGSSLLGGGCMKGFGQEKEHVYPSYRSVADARRGSSISTVTTMRDTQDMREAASTPSDEGGSLSRPSSNYRLQGEKQLEQRTLESSSNTYDKQLLSRIGGPSANLNTPKRTSLSYAPPSVQETAQLAHAEAERRNGQPRPLSMPERQQTLLDSPASSRWPSSGAISPGFTAGGFWSEHSPPEFSRLHTSYTPRRGSLAFDDSVSQRGSYDQSMLIRGDLMEDESMSHLNIYDRSPGSSEDFQPNARAGTKRRASSPPRDASREERSSVSSASGHSDLYHRRSIQQLPTRGSPVSRFHPNHSSLSSASSFGPRQNSFGSSLGVSSIPSSATSYGSGRLSPGGLSPCYDTSPEHRLSNASNVNLTAAAGTRPLHQRTVSESTQSVVSSAHRTPTESASHSRTGSISQLQGVYICECCPKKPKKFDTEDELRLHESEKQYICAYCPNRFKNKNEAERHQNSLHLRRHSWSCAALEGVEAAFHTATSGNHADACGYCGDEFPNPPQWDIRAEHLNHVHKFGECNQAKKFFRADHFRQHLKHSHAGTSGKWTNQLEIACMKDEPLPEKRASVLAQAPPALMISTSGPGQACETGS